MWTYFIQGPPHSPVKIGRATDVKRRLYELQTASPHELRVLLALKGDREAEMHERFASDRVRGEWFLWSTEMDSFMREFSLGLPAAWHMVNIYCTENQRREFNEWRSQSQLSVLAVRDWIREASTADDKPIPTELCQLMKSLFSVPLLVE